MSNKMEERLFPLPEKSTWKECNFCGLNNFSKFSEENGFTIFKCKNCGLIMVNPVPTDEYIQNFYAQYHHPNSALTWARYMSNIYESALRKINKFPAGSTLLDMGCGYGQFLKLAQKEKFDVYGLEIASGPVDYIEKEYRIPVFRGNLENAPFQDNFFDVITLWFALEHLMDPHKTVNKCYHLLKKNGLIIICVPNIDLRKIFIPLRNLGFLEEPLVKIGIRVGTVRLFNAIDPPAHLFGFNKDSLQYLLSKTGFKELSFEIPEDLVLLNIVSRIAEFIFNLNAKIVRILSCSKLFISNSLIILGRK